MISRGGQPCGQSPVPVARCSRDMLGLALLLRQDLWALQMPDSFTLWHSWLIVCLFRNLQEAQVSIRQISGQLQSIDCLLASIVCCSCSLHRRHGRLRCGLLCTIHADRAKRPLPSQSACVAIHIIISRRGELHASPMAKYHSDW